MALNWIEYTPPSKCWVGLYVSGISPTGRGRLRCQVQCCTLTKDEPGENTPDENEKHPADAEWLWSAPGRSVQASLRPQDAARAEPSQVQCYPWSGTALSPERSSPRCFRHWRRAETNLAKYNVAHSPKTNRGKTYRLEMKNTQQMLSVFHLESGNVLLSRAVSSQVPSALKGLTSVFGMGTGGSLSPLSPECFQGAVQSAFFLASALSIHNQSFRLGELPYNCALFYCAYPENRTSRSLHLVKNQSLTSIFPLVSLDSQFL